MFRSVSYGLVVAALSVCLFHGNNIAMGRTDVSGNLEGVYEFVSEATVLTTPKKGTHERTSAEWSGLWQLQNGYYTRVLMKRQRARFFESKKLDDLGFESFAGRYEIQGAKLSLTQEYSFNPFGVGHSALFDYKVEGNTLTLIEKLYPHVEDMREGTTTIVLRRVK